MLLTCCLFSAISLYHTTLVHRIHEIVLMYSKPTKHLDAVKMLAKGLIWLFIDAMTKQVTISHH